MPLLPTLAVLALALPQGTASVRVLGADGRPAEGVKVVLQVGLARFALTEDFDRWLALERKEGTTDAEGRAQFAGLSGGARLTVFARAEGSSALVEGAAGELQLRLEPAGSLRGKVTGKKVDPERFTVLARGPRGLEWKKAAVDSKGNWELEDVPAGALELELRHENWLAARAETAVEPGKIAKAPRLEGHETFLTGADPVADVRKVLLVDERKKPFGGRWFWWSSPWMDGGSVASAEGEVLLEGGNVAIGPPPYVLRLGMIGDEEQGRYLGRLLEEKRGTAVVQVVEELGPLSCTLERGGQPVTAFVLCVVGGGEAPRVWQAKVANGVGVAPVPTGRLRLVFSTADGRVHVETLEKAEPGPLEHVLRIAE